LNNKKIGTDFEQEFCQLLSERGYWVHFLNPDKTGSQPFDVIAVKNGTAYAFDCKTSASDKFSINRLEDNQILAFEKWIRCGNTAPMIAVKYNDDIIILYYEDLKAMKFIDLKPQMRFYTGWEICSKRKKAERRT
jgi:Holliday junction resolvase